MVTRRTFVQLLAASPFAGLLPVVSKAVPVDAPASVSALYDSWSPENYTPVVRGRVMQRVISGFGGGDISTKFEIIPDSIFQDPQPSGLGSIIVELFGHHDCIDACDRDVELGYVVVPGEPIRSGTKELEVPVRLEWVVRKNGITLTRVPGSLIEIKEVRP